MRIIKTSVLREFWRMHPEAEASLRMWTQQVTAAQWRTFAEVRKTFPNADAVKVASGRQVVVFNIAHNRHRLIAAIHYNTRIVYTLLLLAHKDYDRNVWRDQL
ncbi:MAG: type II toxin-antitoxin system HigB family toxin [Planctomycetia bacterium]|nr:type II toxin-antitoxin system HigB family toxin [Planctomycetia bacterium]